MIPDTILVVDDDEINRGILENLFASFYRVEEAENVFSSGAGASATLTMKEME